jgi:hypothetical protein
MSGSLGKKIVTMETVDKTGLPLMVLMSNPITIYERANGSYFYKSDGKRVDVQCLADGTFHQKIVSEPISLDPPPMIFSERQIANLIKAFAL